MTRLAARPLVLIGLIVLTPIVLALLFFYGPRGWLPRGGAAHGELLDPVIEAPAGALPMPGGGQTASDWFRGRWSLIYARSGACGALCAGDLNRLNQVRLRLGRDSDRVRLVLLTDGTPPALPAAADLMVALLTGPAGERWREALERWPLAEGAVFVADPLGNLLIRYSPEIAQADLLDDLERLLDVSQIG